jgi:uncharacterized GH25 family protein
MKFFTPNFRRSALPSALAFVLLLAASAVAVAHDFWLVPDAFRLAPGDSLVVRGQTSSLFPTSESAVAADRIVEARLLSAGDSVQVTEISRAGTSLLLRHRPHAAGQHLLAVRLAPRFVRETPASLRRYMELEGAPELLALYERQGLLPAIDSPDSLTRSYEKYAKTIVEVGAGPRAFDRRAGHPLEIIPLADPSSLRYRDTIGVRLTFRGSPLAGAHLHAGSMANTPSTRTDTAAARRAARDDLHLVTDSAGVIRVPIRRAGIWNIRALHIVPASGTLPSDWEVHWATLVFLVEDSPRR